VKLVIPTAPKGIGMDQFGRKPDYGKAIGTLFAKGTKPPAQARGLFCAADSPFKIDLSRR
jgi:hypothetical protein